MVRHTLKTGCPQVLESPGKKKKKKSVLESPGFLNLYEKSWKSPGMLQSICSMNFLFHVVYNEFLPSC